MKNHTVAFVVFDIFDDTLDLRDGTGTLPRLVVPVGLEPHPSPGDVFQGIARLRQIKPLELLGITVGYFNREDSAFVIKILEISQRKPGRKSGAPEDSVLLILCHALLFVRSSSFSSALRSL